MGLEQEVHKGSDNLIRTVTLKTKAGIRRRSVQRLYLLEEAQSKEVQSKEAQFKEVQSKEVQSKEVQSKEV